MRPRPLSRFRFRLAATVIAAGLALGAAQAGHAQFGGRSGMATMFTPDFLPRDLPIFVDSLQLEEWQRPILEALLEDYDTSFKTAADGVRSAMSAFRDKAAGASGEQVISMISQPLVAWTAEKRKLKDEFLENVRSQLGDSQVDLWPRLERALRRDKSLPAGELSGESLNLLLVARELNAEAMPDAATAALEQYELDLDAALAERDAALETAIKPLLDAMSTGDFGAGARVQEQIMGKRLVVRKVQEDSIAAMRDALGGDLGARFEKRALQKAFPQVFRPNPISPLFESALALPELTPDQKGQVESLRSQFDAELADLQLRHCEAYRLTEPREPKRRADAAQARMAGSAAKMSEPPELESIKKERESLFKRYQDALSAILSPDQRAAVPGLATEPADPNKPVLDRRGNPLVPGAAPVEAPVVPEGGKPSANPEMPSAEDDKVVEPRQPAEPSFGPNPGGGAGKPKQPK